MSLPGFVFTSEIAQRKEKAIHARSSNWNISEVWALLDGVSEHHNQVVKKKFGTLVTAGTRAEAWNIITEGVNAVGGTVVRTSAQVEKKWSDIKSKSLATISSFRRETSKTGGGNKPPPLSDLDVKVEEIVGTRNAIISGVVGGVDTSAPQTAREQVQDVLEELDANPDDSCECGDGTSETPSREPSLPQGAKSTETPSCNNQRKKRQSSGHRGDGPFSREDLLELEIKRAKLQIEVLNLEKEKLTKEISKLETETINQTLLQQKLILELNEKGIVVQLN